MKHTFTTLITLACCSMLTSQTASFVQAPGSPIATNTSQRGMVAKDMNGDGIQDLFVCNPNSKTVRVLKGTGGGQFVNNNVVNIGYAAIYIVVDDFNGDSFLDFATANYSDNNVTIYKGNGTGAFTPLGLPVTVGAYPYCIDAADFNGDGIKDLVTCNVNSNNIHVLIGNGAGSFTVSASSPITTGGGAYHVVAGKFNSDNFMDFAVVNATNNNVGVYLGNGNGTFAAPASYAVGSQPRTVSVADLNADNFPDFVVCNLTSNNVSILLGSSSGVFTNASGSPISSSSPYQSTIADFNLDGKPDVAIANYTAKAYSIFYGNGTGGFTAASNSPISLSNSDPQPVCSGDFNNDGKPDLAMGDWVNSFVNVLLNDARTVGINEQESVSSQVSVFPNPASGLVYVNVPAVTASTGFVLYNVLGQEVLNTKLGAANNGVDVSGLQRGIYFYSVYQDKRVLQNGQLILNN